MDYNSVHRHELPDIGEKNRLYPHKYGFCQCGCGRRTKPFPSGVYPRYLPKHHLSAAENFSKIDTVQALGTKFVELEKKIQKTIKEIEIVAKLVDDYWNISAYEKNLALVRLATIIHNLKRSG